MTRSRTSIRIDRRRFVASVASALGATSVAGQVFGQERALPIATWGDSLTFGTGASRIVNRYPNALGASFSPPRPVYPAGVGGESSMQIAARMLADTEHRDWIAVLWAGRNNYQSTEQVLADIAAMVGHHRGDRYLVLSIPNANVPEEYRGGPGYDAILTLNDKLQAQYRGRYLDIRRHLVQDGLRDRGLSPSPQDLVDIGHDVPPTALRADHIHLNDAGQAEVAQRVRAFIEAQGW